MIEESSSDAGPPISDGRPLFCNVCSHQWAVRPSLGRFGSIDELVRVAGLRRDEVTTLAEIGALNSFGMDRRSALWQAERAVRPAGELFDPIEARGSIVNSASPLPAMSEEERLVADYAGSGLTIGRHPMALRRHDLSMRGVLRAVDLPQARPGRRVRTAGMVITRQRPGTAKGFVFLTLEDETGVANVIIRPDVYAVTRLVVVESPFLLVEGVLQNQDGVTSVRAERLQRLDGLSDGASVESHDFH
jgi:error-prone DNA polymerase